jgi:protoporphyrinogen oxidase
MSKNNIKKIKKKKIIILGGGLTGLAAADKLIIHNNVTIIEKETFLGGLAGSFKYKDKYVPIHYHHVFKHDYITHKYLKRFGLLSDMLFKKIKMCICVNNKQYDFTNPLKLLSFDYLSFWGRIRYGLFGFWALFLMNPDNIPDKLNAKDWLYKVAGIEVTKKIMGLLQARNKFGISLNKISAKQFANRIKAGEAIGKFGYPKKGLQKLIDGMENTLNRRDVTILKNCHIEKIDLKRKTLNIINGGQIKYDIIINTIPIPEFLNIAINIPKDYKEKLSKISYCPAITVVFGTDKFLSDHYWLNMLNERIHMVMQHSWLYDGYDTKISWALRYGKSYEDFHLSDDEIKKAYLKVVKEYFPHIKIKWSKVFKQKYASPIYHKDYYKNKPDYDSPIKSLYNAGVAVTYPNIRNMNTAFESGMKVANIITENIKNNNI